MEATRIINLWSCSLMFLMKFDSKFSMKCLFLIKRGKRNIQEQSQTKEQNCSSLVVNVVGWSPKPQWRDWCVLHLNVPSMYSSFNSNCQNLFQSKKTLIIYHVTKAITWTLILQVLSFNFHLIISASFKTTVYDPDLKKCI